MYLASTIDVDVVIHDPRRFILVLRRDGTVAAYGTNDIQAVDELYNHKTLYLFDPDEERSQALMCNAFTVIATAPDTKHYSNFRKIARNMQTRWMYPWELNELYAAHRAVQPNGTLSRQQIANIKERFACVGGSLRLSFASDDYYNGILTQMKAQVKGMTINTVDYYIETIVSECNVANDIVPHLLLHCYAPANDSKDLYSLSWASLLSRTLITTALVTNSAELRERKIEESIPRS